MNSEYEFLISTLRKTLPNDDQSSFYYAIMSIMADPTLNEEARAEFRNIIVQSLRKDSNRIEANYDLKLAGVPIRRNQPNNDTIHFYHTLNNFLGLDPRITALYRDFKGDFLTMLSGPCLEELKSYLSTTGVIEDAGEDTDEEVDEDLYVATAGRIRNNRRSPAARFLRARASGRGGPSSRIGSSRSVGREFFSQAFMSPSGSNQVTLDATNYTRAFDGATEYLEKYFPYDGMFHNFTTFKASLKALKEVYAFAEGDSAKRETSAYIFESPDTKISIKLDRHSMIQQAGMAFWLNFVVITLLPEWIRLGHFIAITEAHRSADPENQELTGDDFLEFLADDLNIGSVHVYQNLFASPLMKSFEDCLDMVFQIDLDGDEEDSSIRERAAHAFSPLASAILRFVMNSGEMMDQDLDDDNERNIEQMPGQFRRAYLNSAAPARASGARANPYVLDSDIPVGTFDHITGG